MPITSLIDVTATYCKQTGVQKVGILATPTTIKHGLYSNALAKFDIEVVALQRGEQLKTLIERTIAGKTPLYSQLMPYIQQLCYSGAEKIILGCTELSVIAENVTDSRLIDPIDLVVKEMFK